MAGAPSAPPAEKEETVPGTRSDGYRCSLPGLAGFANVPSPGTAVLDVTERRQTPAKSVTWPGWGLPPTPARRRRSRNPRPPSPAHGRCAQTNPLETPWTHESWFAGDH